MIQIRNLEDTFGAAASALIDRMGSRSRELVYDWMDPENFPDMNRDVGRPLVVILESREEVKRFLGFTGEDEPPELATSERLCSGLPNFERSGVNTPRGDDEFFAIRVDPGDDERGDGFPGAWHLFHMHLASPAERRLLEEETE